MGVTGVPPVQFGVQRELGKDTVVRPSLVTWCRFIYCRQTNESMNPIVSFACLHSFANTDFEQMGVEATELADGRS